MYRFVALYMPIIFVLIVADQGSKYWARMALTADYPWVLTPFFEFTLHFNRGAAFSMLNEGHLWQYLFLVSVSILVTVILSVWLFRLNSARYTGIVGLLLLMAGAIGNLIDRIVFKQVTDFIAIHWDAYYFPTFNIADSMITIGVILFVLDMYVNEPSKTSSA